MTHKAISQYQQTEAQPVPKSCSLPANFPPFCCSAGHHLVQNFFQFSWSVLVLPPSTFLSTLSSLHQSSLRSRNVVLVPLSYISLNFHQVKVKFPSSPSSLGKPVFGLLAAFVFFRGVTRRNGFSKIFLKKGTLGTQAQMCRTFS